MQRPIEHRTMATAQNRRSDRPSLPGKVVLVLQGGGALGAYQAGVYQALQEAGVEPDWIIGTSIGAINASLIAGNPPARRLQAVREFWARVPSNHAWNRFPAWTGVGDAMSYWATLCGGVSGFSDPTQPPSWERMSRSAPTGPASTPRCRCARHWASLSIRHSSTKASRA